VIDFFVWRRFGGRCRLPGAGLRRRSHRRHSRVAQNRYDISHEVSAGNVSVPHVCSVRYLEFIADHVVNDPRKARLTWDPAKSTAAEAAFGIQNLREYWLHSISPIGSWHAFS